MEELNEQDAQKWLDACGELLQYINRAVMEACEVPEEQVNNSITLFAAKYTIVKGDFKNYSKYLLQCIALGLRFSDYKAKGEILDWLAIPFDMSRLPDPYYEFLRQASQSIYVSIPHRLSMGEVIDLGQQKRQEQGN